MILRKANIYDANDIAKVHLKVWTEFYKERVSNAFLKHFDFEYRRKYWVRFISENRICFVVEEKGGSIDAFIVPTLKRLKADENVGEITMNFVNNNASFENNFGALLISTAMLFNKNNANSMRIWVHRDSEYINLYKKYDAIETKAKVERMDSKDIIKLCLEWEDLEKTIERHSSILDTVIVEF